MKNRNLDHKNDWRTPKYLIEELEREFWKMFDPCPFQHDLSKWDWLKREWGNINFINPPYSRKLKELFIRKAYDESLKGKLCIMLLPVSTSTKIFHEIIYPYGEIRFIFKRIKFSGWNSKGVYVTKSTGMHDSMLVIFKSQTADTCDVVRKEC